MDPHVARARRLASEYGAVIHLSLFGSRFWGDARPTSDFDFFAVIAEPFKRIVMPDFKPTSAEAVDDSVEPPVEIKVASLLTVTKQILKGNINYLYMLTAGAPADALLEKYMLLAVYSVNPVKILKSWQGWIKGSSQSSEGQALRHKQKSRHRNAVRFSKWLIATVELSKQDPGWFFKLINARFARDNWRFIESIAWEHTRPRIGDQEYIWKALEYSPEDVEHVPLFEDKQQELLEAHYELMKRYACNL